MRFTSFWKSIVAAAAVVLPALPFALCLGFRLVEAWKIWDEMNRLTLAGVLAWLWAVAFLGASIVTIFRLGSRRSLGRWELLIDAANTIMTALLAIESADRHPAVLHAFGYGWQVAILFLIFLVPQFTVTFLAREVRSIARRLRTSLPAQKPEEPIDRAVFIMPFPTPRAHTAPTQTVPQPHGPAREKETLAQ